MSIALVVAEDRLQPGQEGPLKIADCPHPCVLHVPKDYVAGTRLPLVLFMHGSGGTPTTYPFKDATGGRGYFVVGLSYGGQPDGGAGGIQSDPATVSAMIAFFDRVRATIDATYGIDQKRVFLAGLSMGGWGVNIYGFTKASQGRYRGYGIFAAGARTDADLTIAKGYPVLVVNGAQDANLPVANAGMPLLEKAGALAKQVVLDGEGHVPSQAAMNAPISEWLESIEKAEARGRALAAVQWRSGEIVGAPTKKGNTDADAQAALGAYLQGQAFMTDVPADQPVLVFCRSRQEAKNGQPSPQAKDSASVDEACFSYPGANGTPAASRYFACVDVNVSAIDAKQNPVLNQTTAPQVILLAKDRSVAAVLKGKAKLTDAALQAEMMKVLDAEASTVVSERMAQAAPVLKELQSLQKKLRAKNDGLAKLREMPAKDAASRKAKSDRIAQEESALKAMDSDYDALRQRLAE